MSNFKKRMESYRRHPGSFLLFLLVMLSALATFVGAAVSDCIHPD